MGSDTPKETDAERERRAKEEKSEGNGEHPDQTSSNEEHAEQGAGLVIDIVLPDKSPETQH